ncbi:MAG TPA: hypothetical protein VHR36_08055 [Pyrinomonadaceae bacterium]|nr:hypothetical protein [Pyrinomonadaceae bacterium]
MRVFILSRALLIFACLGLCWNIGSAQTRDDTPLTNDAVVKLVKANFKEKTVIAIIESRATRFDLSTERMIELKRTGVSERIILAMLARQQGLDFDAAWNDDAFFNPANDNAKIDKQDDPSRNSSSPGNSADIFGSSGGSRGGTRTKGGNNTSGANDTVTTGSATVHILRPPAEAGALPKMDRVATLTNDSIVELIEAGFSEGTIIRRIEQSPVEFDLTPGKLAELRKHRVSEKILSAMKTATGDTSDSKSAPVSNGTPRQ